jgi:hypothetical protein
VLNSYTDPYLNACINWTLDSSGLYCEGYFDGASRLVSELKQNNMGIDSLVYPIAFLYRQYLELKLKYMIRDSRLLLGEQGSFPTHHNISALWCTVNGNILKIIKDVDPSLSNHIPKSELKAVKGLIDDFSEYDPDSMAFRYPTGKGGGKHLDGLKYVNLELLESQMLELKVLLDKFDMAIDYLRDLQRECW